MVRRTCDIIAVLAQADTRLSAMGATWGSAAQNMLVTNRNRRYVIVRSRFVAGNGPETNNETARERRRRLTAIPGAG